MLPPLIGILEYFRSRRPRIMLDVVSSVPILRQWPNDVSKNEMFWQPEQRREVLQYADKVFVNEQTLALEDRLTLKLSWIYYHKIRGEEMPVGSRLSTPPSYVRFVKRLVAAGDYDVFWLNFPVSPAWPPRSAGRDSRRSWTCMICTVAAGVLSSRGRRAGSTLD